MSQAEVYDLGASLGFWNPDRYDDPTAVAYPQLQIHDELLFACRKDVADDLGYMVKEVFEHCVRLSVPVKAGSATADNWGKLVK